MTQAQTASALVIGAGLMGQWHVHTIRRLGIPIAGIVDPDVDRARKCAGIAGSDRVFSTIDEALNSVSATTAHICTPTETHAMLIAKLLDAGVHVLSEKPLAGTASETQELVERARELGLQLCPVHQFIFQSGFLEAHARARRSTRLLHVDYVAVSAGALGKGPDMAEALVEEILPHPLSLIRRLVGADVMGMEWSVSQGPYGELRAQSRWEDAWIGILVSTHGRPTRNTLRLVTDQGTSHVDFFHGYAFHEPPGVSRRRKILRPFAFAGRSGWHAGRNLVGRALRREPAYPGLRTLVAQFYDAVVERGPAPIEPTEVIDVAVVRDRLMARRTG